MSRLATAFVLGYHGCSREVAEQAVAGRLELLHSDKAYDWLGPGAYFWESDPQRALEWAEDKAQRGQLSDPSVVGAVIDLGECLDLASRENLVLVKSAHRSFIAQQIAADLPLPTNRSAPREADPDKGLRCLDCAVIRHLHRMIEAVPQKQRKVRPFDIVRGIFTEGEPLYAGCGFRERTHVQIAVRNATCIKGVFKPR